MQSVTPVCVLLLLEAAKEVPMTVQSWTKHMPKMTQPNLDYIGEVSRMTVSLTYAHTLGELFQ